MVAGGKSRGRGGGGGRGKAAGAGGGVAKPKPRPAPGARAGGVGAGRGRGAKGKGAQSGGEYSSAALKEKRDDLKNTLKVGDDAFVLAEPDSPWAFNVVHIKDISRDRKKVTVSWYYRPEDAPCGRKMFHGTQELFASDHVDVIAMESIESICKVRFVHVKNELGYLRAINSALTYSCTHAHILANVLNCTGTHTESLPGTRDS